MHTPLHAVFPAGLLLLSALSHYAQALPHRAPPQTEPLVTATDGTSSEERLHYAPLARRFVPTKLATAAQVAPSITGGATAAAAAAAAAADDAALRRRSPKDPEPDQESSRRTPVVGFEMETNSHRQCGLELISTTMLASSLWDNVGSPSQPAAVLESFECGVGGHAYRESEWFIARALLANGTADAWVMGQKAIEDDYELVCCLHTLGVVTEDGVGWAPCPAPGHDFAPAAINTTSTIEERPKKAGFVSFG